MPESTQDTAMFGNPLSSPAPQSAQPQERPAPPPFKQWADSQIAQMSGGSASRWDDLDKVFAALPEEPGKEKKDTAGDIKRQLVKQYTDNVLPQYYQDPHALKQAQAFTESSLAPHLLSSAFKPVLAAQEAAAAKDPNAEVQDSYTRLMEDATKTAAEKARAGIGLDSITRVNGKKIVDELKLADVDTIVAEDRIKQEKAKRVAKGDEIEAQYNAGQISYEDAQAKLDALYRESQNLDGALNVLKDTNDIVAAVGWGAGGVAKGFLAIPEVMGRVYSGTVSGLSGEGFGKGWNDEDSFGAWVGSVADDVGDMQEELSKYDSSYIAQQYVMQAYKDGDASDATKLLMDNPAAAYSMIATSGADSIAQFFGGGWIGKGSKMAVGAAASLPQVLKAAPSLGAMKDVVVGAVKASKESAGAAAWYRTSAIGTQALAAGLGDARDVGDYLQKQYDGMSTDQFLSMQDVQAEKDVWMNMPPDRLATYIANKKADMVGQAMATTTGMNTALLSATGYLGSKFGMEKFLLGKVGAAVEGETLGAATGVTQSVIKGAALQGLGGGMLEAGESVTETGVQHAITTTYLNRDLSTSTPFDNFAGAAMSGLVVGAAMDGVGGYFEVSKSNEDAAALHGIQAKNAAREAAAGTTMSKEEAAAIKAKNADMAARKAAAFAAVDSEWYDPAANDFRPQAWAGGAYTDKDGNIVTTEGNRFNDAELATPDVQARIDRAWDVFTADTDPYSPLAILTAPDGMGLSGAQRGQIELWNNVATDKTVDPVVRYRARAELLRVTNSVRATHKARNPDDVIMQVFGSGKPGNVGSMQGNQGKLLPAPERAQTPAGPNEFTDPLLTWDGTIYGAPPANSLPVPAGPLESAPYVDAEWGIEERDPGLDPNVIYGGWPESYTDVYEVLGLPAPPRGPNTGAVDTRGMDGLAGFPQDAFNARGRQQISTVTNSTVPPDFADALADAYHQAQAKAAEEKAAAEQQAQEPTPLPVSRTATAMEANVPVTSHGVTTASVVSEDGKLGAQVMHMDDGMTQLVLSGDAGGTIRVSTMDLSALAKSATNTVGKGDSLAATQLALTTAVNRLKGVFPNFKAMIPALRLAIAQAVMSHVKAEDFADLEGAKLKKRMAGLVFLQRTIEEDKARIVDGPRGKVALEYVTGIRDVLPKTYPKVKAAVLQSARVNWHKADNLLRTSGFYNEINADAAKVGVGKPAKKPADPKKAQQADVVERGALAAHEAADNMEAGQLPSPEQAAQVIEAVLADDPVPPEQTPPSAADIKQALAAYESDPRTLRWKELKTREDALQRQGKPVPARTAQEKADSDWTKAERKRIARMQIAAAGGKYLRSPLPGYGEPTKIDMAAQVRADLSSGDTTRILAAVRSALDDGSVEGAATGRLIAAAVMMANKAFGYNNKVEFVDTIKAEADSYAAGVYRPKSHDIQLSVRDNNGMFISPIDLVRTFGHEVIHMATNRAMTLGRWLTEHKKTPQTEADKLAVAFYNEVKGIHMEALARVKATHPVLAKLYGFTDPEEFMAELSDPAFKKVLDVLRSPSDAEPGFVSRFFAAVARLLGFQPGDTRRDVYATNSSFADIIAAMDSFWMTALKSGIKYGPTGARVKQYIMGDLEPITDVFDAVVANRAFDTVQVTAAIGNMWAEVEANGNPREFMGEIPTDYAVRTARAIKEGMGTPDFDEWVALSLEDAPINGAVTKHINEPLENC